MKVKLRTDEYTIFERRDGRFAIKDAGGNPLNGDDKIEILLQNGLIELAAPRSEEASSDDETEDHQTGEEEDASKSSLETDAADAEVVESPGEETDTESEEDPGSGSDGTADENDDDAEINEQPEKGEDKN